MHTRLIILIAFAIGISACTPQKKVLYFQSAENAGLPIYSPPENEVFALKVVPNDILLVDIYTLNPEALPGFTQNLERPIVDNRTAYEKGFVVDEAGYIELPLIGKTFVSGLTLTETKDTLANRLKKFILEPTVTVKKMSFKLSILGEVGKPGLYYVRNERVTFSEAIAMAGDLSDFGNRKTVKVFRKVDGKIHQIPIDLTTQNVLSSSGMIMHPDDIIYVEPVRGKRFNNISPGLGLFTSILTTTVVVLTFIINQSRP
ncbi:MAG: hypothetical protein HKN22_06505 [Bacteroidia bacterium]|nr:hypothetical protein [Bacteroidia bacterium]